MRVAIKRNRLTKYKWKVNEKSTENQRKQFPKIIKNHSWRRLWGPLGALGSQNQKKSQLLGPLGTILDPSWDLLGRPWRLDRHQTLGAHKKQRKINSKSTKNLPKMNQKSVLESLGRPLGDLGGQDQKNANSWGLLGPSWGRLGTLLGLSWRLDRRLGPSWGVLGPSGAVLKSMSKSIKKSMPFKIGFWNDFDGF